MPTKNTTREVQSQMIFLVANVIAGFLHYLYQVFASKNLSGAEFAELNRWFAGLALFFVVGGVLQYAANFIPVSKATLVKALGIVNIIGVLLAAAWFFDTSESLFLRAVVIIIGASLFGWVIGQLQVRVMFIALAFAHLLAALGKLGFVLLPLHWGTLEQYRFALFVGYLPALWLVSIMILKTDAKPVAKKQKSTWHLWMAPLIISAAVAVIPQMDLVLMGRIQPEWVDIEFTRASLFYKAIYFFIFIFAQLFLPHQIAGRWNNIKPMKFLMVAAAISLLGSALITLVAPFAGEWILNWSEQPSSMLVFISCLNMSFLAWLLLLIQEACARVRVHQAGLALVILGAEAVGQLLIHSTVWRYYFLALPVQIVLVISLAYAVRSPNGRIGSY